MKTELEPNTSEWLEMRRNYIGASDAPIIMGVSPWKNIRDLWNDKLGMGIDAPANFYMKRGIELEPIARKAYELHTGNIVHPKLVFHPTIKYMMANLDGITEKKDIAVEIKCPGEKDHNLAKQGIVPEKYIPQLQHQLEVIGIDCIHYFSYRDGDIALIEVGRDDSYIKNLCIEEKKFWDCVESLKPPVLKEVDCITRNDTDWETCASKWENVNGDIDKANEYLDKLKSMEAEYREQLVKISGNRNTMGCGIKLQKITRKGNVDYKLIPELKGVKLDNYRKNSTEYWKITKIKDEL